MQQPPLRFEQLARAGLDARPLSGLRVLDLTRLLPGAFLTDLLVGLGADVLKVEAPEGDGLRGIGPMIDGESFTMWALARGKRSLVVDLKHPAGRAALLALVRAADVLVHSFRPGVVDRLGIGYDDCRGANAAIVIAALQGYDADGPMASAAGHDINFLATAGLLSLNDGGGRGEIRVLPVPFADLTSALATGLGIMAAVLAARSTGVGAELSVAMEDVAMSLIGTEINQIAGTDGEVEITRGALSGVLPCYTTYQCADDRWMAVGALEPKFWRTVCAALDRPDLVDRQYDVRAVADLAAVFGQHPQSHWARIFASVDGCVTPVVSVAEAAARAGALPSDGIGPARLPTPYVVGGRRLTRDGRPPALGEHTCDALSAAGLAADEIAELVATGAVVQGGDAVRDRPLS